MKITQNVERTETVEEIVDVLCNRCGRSCKSPRRGASGHYGLIEQNVSGGFDSYVLPDCTSFTFSLCEPCLGALFTEFKHPPVVHDYGGVGNVSGTWIDGKFVFDPHEEPTKE